jgi:hypothetical protein
MYRLLVAGLLDAELFTLVIPPRGAELWLEHVAPLDRAIRQRVQGEPPNAPHPIESFYRNYAAGQLPAFVVARDAPKE